jgi:TPR repeat protein
LIICGFAARSVFSAGRSIDENTWVLPVAEAADLTLLPPRGFVGPMKLVVVLVNTDRSLADRRTVLLQWLPQTSGVSAAPAPQTADVNDQLEEGKRLRSAGNLAGARAIFQRHAATGDSRAAFLLAETYDPIVLARYQHHLLPPDSDLEKARLWYRRASQRGSPEANARLDRLSDW